MLKNFVYNNRMQEAIASANRAAGNTVINGKSLDFSGWLGGAVTVVEMGDIAATAVTSIVMEATDDDPTGASPDWKELDDTELTVAPTDDGKYFVIEVFNPRHRYMRVKVKRATANAAVRSAYYILHGPRKAVTSYPDEFKSVEIAVGPPRDGEMNA